jgi:hypothetical protein
MAQRLAEKYRSLIKHQYEDEDGYWIELIDGYMNGCDPWCHGIHEDTKNTAYDVLRFAVLCDCPEHKEKKN